MTVDVDSGGAAILRLSGRLDLSSASDVKEQLARAVEQGHRRLIVDLEDVPFVDSSGLGALISGLKVARLAGGDLRICSPGAQPRLALELTSLNRVFQPYATVEEALAGY